MTTSTVQTSHELATFLRIRRERLNPEDFDLPRRRQSRRTPGLRREEVAELAGVSTDYIVRLEQARGLRPSADVAEALAQALRLTPDERTYLFNLAQHRPTGVTPSSTPSPPLARLVSDLSPRPAMLLNCRTDILAWNEQMAWLLTDFGALPPAQHNAMWLCLMHPQLRERYVDREGVVRDAVAHLRAAWAAHPDDRVLIDLIDEFIAGNEAFARLWTEREVRLNGRGIKEMRHPGAGPLRMEFEMLTPVQDRGQLVLIGRAADDASRLALDRLFAARTAGAGAAPVG